MCNSNESGHSWQTPCIRVKGSDRRPFNLILDWILLNATLIMGMNLSLYCSRIFAKQKRQNLNQLCQ